MQEHRSLWSVQVDSSSLAVQVSCVSGAQLSNYATFLLHPEQAPLSIVLTALSTAAGVFMTPALALLLLGARIPVDAQGMALSITQIVLVPVLAGDCSRLICPTTPDPFGHACHSQECMLHAAIGRPSSLEQAVQPPSLADVLLSLGTVIMVHCACWICKPLSLDDWLCRFDVQSVLPQICGGCEALSHLPVSARHLRLRRRLAGIQQRNGSQRHWPHCALPGDYPKSPSCEHPKSPSRIDPNGHRMNTPDGRHTWLCRAVLFARVSKLAMERCCR